MLRRMICSVGLILITGSSAFGQPPSGPRPGEHVADETPSQPTAPRSLAGSDPLGMLKAMEDDLKLDDGQREKARQFLTDYRTKQIEARKAFRPPMESTDRTREILLEMRAAQEAGDRERISALSDQLRQIREEQGGQLEPMRAELKRLQDELHTNLRGIMRDDQHEGFERLWDERMINRGAFRGRVRSPQALRALVEKLPDVSDEQKQQIDGLFKAHMESVREVKNNARERERLSTKLYDDVMALLTPEQRETVSKQLEGRGRIPPKPEKGEKGQEPATPDGK